MQETMRWLLTVGLIATDKDCINQKHQARVGYSIPGWNANAQLLMISEEQIEQIKQLYQLRHRKYYQRDQLAATIDVLGQDDVTWLEDQSLDLDDSHSNEVKEAWLDDLDGEELAEEESAPPALP